MTRFVAGVATCLLAGLLGLSPALAGGALQARLQLVTDVPEMEGMQAGNPVWAPGDVPRLVHELSDRSRRTWLRVVAVQDGELFDYLVPGTRSSRLGALGAGDQRSDGEARWWGPSGFYFVRAVGEGSELHVFDGVPRKLPLDGRVQEVAPDPERRLLYLAMGAQESVDVFAWSQDDLTEPAARLSNTQGEVEHSLTLDPVGRRLVWIASSREGTEVVQAAVGEGVPAVQRHRVDGFELLSAVPIPRSSAVVVTARACATPPACTEDAHALVRVDMATGAAKVLAHDIMVPPGEVRPPALSPEGRFVYFVRRDEAAANPVVRMDLATGIEVGIATGTRGNQQVAVSAYSDEAGNRVPWLAVVAVGGRSEDDVRNHVYMGPLAATPAEEPR